ncbi:MAG: proton-conducting transporter membrane subunit [Elusimicrobiota bacterium]
MNSLALYLIGFPLISGVLCLVFPRLREFLALIVSLTVLVFSVILFIQQRIIMTPFFRLDNLSEFILMAIALFGFLITLYSLEYMKAKKTVGEYYTYILWALSASVGIVLANNYIILLTFWGFLGLILYLLIQIGVDTIQNTEAARKTLIIVGGSDALMLLGIALLWVLTGTFEMGTAKISMVSPKPVESLMLFGWQLEGVKSVSVLASGIGIIAYICFITSAFAKAGVMPVHTWIPDMSVVTSLPVTAYLPAALDKLLGIYLLSRVCLNLFEYNIWANLVLIIIGMITIIAAVLLAMVQHDMRKLLSYHAVSQVGYMVIGIATANPIGIAGGIFHMLNHAIYKSCLFLTSGSIKNRTGITDLDNMGGLWKYMPITFITCLISALSISGIPPLNGFVSKWMIYQGIVEYSTNLSNPVAVFGWFALAAAMFGSALTVASFMKIIHAAFLGVEHENFKGVINEVPWTMWVPQAVLALLSVVFGIFAFQLPIQKFIVPALVSLGVTDSVSILVKFVAMNNSGIAIWATIAGIAIGVLVYFINKNKIRRVPNFIGGETLLPEERVSGVDFYTTIREIKVMDTFLKLSERKLTDIYELCLKAMMYLASLLSAVHTGNLHVYLGWFLIGATVLLIVLM